MNYHQDITHKQKNCAVNYSFCTLVTNKSQYENLLSSAKKAGFGKNNSEFLYIDNTEENNFDAFQGIKHFLHNASGQYLILCHQDLLFNFDGEKELRGKLEFLSSFDPFWLIAGNAGGSGFYEFAYCITHLSGTYENTEKFPFKAKSLDENFLVLNAKWSPTISVDLKGFHLYGTELCKLANLAGHTCYVIDFHLEHLGSACLELFDKSKNELINKYKDKLKSDFIQTTCTRIVLTSGVLSSKILNSSFMNSIIKKYSCLRTLINKI